MQDDNDDLQHQRNRHYHSLCYAFQPCQQKSKQTYLTHTTHEGAHLLFLFLSDGLLSLSLACHLCLCPYFPCLGPLIRIVVNSLLNVQRIPVVSHSSHHHLSRYHHSSSTNMTQSQPSILHPIFLTLNYILLSFSSPLIRNPPSCVLTLPPEWGSKRDRSSLLETGVGNLPAKDK